MAKDMQPNQQRKKHMGKVQGKPDINFQGSFPMESHMMCLVAPAISYDNTHGMLPTKKLVRDSTSRILLGLIMQATSARNVPKFQSPRKKAGAWHKPHCLYKQCRHSESLLSVLGMVGTLPKFKFPNASQRSTY